MAKPRNLFSTKLAAIESADALCDIARPLIEAKARRLIRRPEFGSSDQKDIEQEAFVRLLERYASCRRRDCPVMVFVKRIVDQSAANLIRSRLAQRRDPRSVCSLNSPASAGEQFGEVGDSVSQAHLDARRGCLSLGAQKVVEMGLDIEEVIRGLSQDQQQLCRTLGVHSVAELARRYQQPRTTLHDRVRAIRRKLEDAGLRNYFQ